MKKVKIVQKEVEIIEDIICNKCGESCRPNDDTPDFYGLIEASFSTGYESVDLPDGLNYTFSLCEKCLSELFDSFKIQPDIEEYIL